MTNGMAEVAQGVLCDEQIEQMVVCQAITAQRPFAEGQVQPASLDLRLGHKAYRVRASFLTGAQRNVQERLQKFKMHEIDLSQGAVLEKGCVYLVPLMEALALPQDINAAASAKSSIGRVDLLTRVITDYGVEFDRIPAGYTGPLYVEICPQSFSVIVQAGQMLNQVIFRKGHTLLGDDELTALHQSNPIVSGAAEIASGLGFSVDLKPQADHLVGYRAKPHTGVIDLAKLAHYRPEDYWEPVYTDQDWIILDPGAFYILVSQEKICIPPCVAAEMAPYLTAVGEFRVHYAGFFDPGFGYGLESGFGSKAVLEVRCHDAPFVLEHGQTVGRLVYERMSQEPKALYGQAIASNYQGQGLKLSKHFKA